jgi:hypothetical protein
MLHHNIQKSARNATGILAGLTLAAGLSGCFRVHVDKDSKGDDKNVQVDTPFGGVHVNTNQISASDLGLPVYPGAKQVSDDDKRKSADVHIGFGEWELRVRAVSYASTDNQDKVAQFYRKALTRYGDVIICQGKSPVGTPTTTSEGLTCSDDSNGNGVKIDHKDYGSSDDSVELKAGSHRHQHIVGFQDSKNGETRFALVALDLPGSGKSSD